MQPLEPPHVLFVCLSLICYKFTLILHSPHTRPSFTPRTVRCQSLAAHWAAPGPSCRCRGLTGHFSSCRRAAPAAAERLTWRWARRRAAPTPPPPPPRSAPRTNAVTLASTRRRRTPPPRPPTPSQVLQGQRVACPSRRRGRRDAPALTTSAGPSPRRRPRSLMSRACHCRGAPCPPPAKKRLRARRDD